MHAIHSNPRLEQFKPAPQAKPSTTPDFWPASSLSQWRAEPRECFRSWLAGKHIVKDRGFRESSFETYCAIFSRWQSFLAARSLGILEAVCRDAHDFFASQRLEPVSRRRYLQLLDKVYRHLKDIGWKGENPLRLELSLERTLPSNWPEGLNDENLIRLRSALESFSGLKGARDRAIFSLTVGAGLRTNELVYLRPEQVQPDYTVRVIPSGVHKPHTSIVLPDTIIDDNDARVSFCWRHWLAEWGELRAQNRVPGTWLIPATATGKQYCPSGLFRRISTWFKKADIHVDQTGANILRNTFARLAFQSERYSLEQIQEFLGHEQIRATIRHVRG